MSEQTYESSGAGDNSDADEVSAVKPPIALPNLDNLLDQIDAVLETNAEEFVNSFVQKGGQ